MDILHFFFLLKIISNIASFFILLTHATIQCLLKSGFLLEKEISGLFS